MEIKDKELHRVAITCIIYNKEGNYLVTKRSPHKKAFPNKWTVPGGGLSSDDYTSTPETHEGGGWYGVVEICLRREVLEEVNLEIGKPKYLLDLAVLRPKGAPGIVLSYYAPYVSGEVTLDEDATEYRWITAEEAKSLDLIPGIDEEIQQVDAILKQ